MLESRAQRVHLSDLEWPFTKIISRLLPALGLAAHSRDLSSCLPMETAGQPTDPNLGIRFLEASLAQLPCAPQHAYRLGPPLVVQWLGLCLPIQGVWVRSLGQEDPLEKRMVTHSSILARGNPTDRGAWWAVVHGVIKS